MMEDLIRIMKVERQEMDPDIICDYNFIVGDLNYRFDTTYDDMIDNDKIKIAPQLIDTYDQMLISMNPKGSTHTWTNDQGQSFTKKLSQKYPNYYEAKINFMPTYKRNVDDNSYKNKKNQAPSYCDRILFKNNTVFPYTINIYGCLDNYFGSDHRPVYLSLNMKGARDDEKKLARS